MAGRRTPQAKTQAQKRIDLSKFANRPVRVVDVDGVPQIEANLEALLAGMEPYLGGVIESLGMAAQPSVIGGGETGEPEIKKTGDLQAAKTVLEFMNKALAAAGTRDTRGLEILTKIAEIRQAHYGRAT